MIISNLLLLHKRLSMKKFYEIEWKIDDIFCFYCKCLFSWKNPNDIKMILESLEIVKMDKRKRFFFCKKYVKINV